MKKYIPRHRHDSPEKEAYMRLIDQGLIDAPTSMKRFRQREIYMQAVRKIIALQFNPLSSGETEAFRRQALMILSLAYEKASRYSPEYAEPPATPVA